MRTINLNGYIDEDVWYGDEITPAMLHDALYGENGEFSDDVRTATEVRATQLFECTMTSAPIRARCIW